MLPKILYIFLLEVYQFSQIVYGRHQDETNFLQNYPLT